MKQLNDWLRLADQELTDAGISTPRLDAQVIAGKVLNRSKAWLLSHPEYKLHDNEIKNLSDILKKRIKHQPLAYIFGEKEFYGRLFKINEHVLVPRPESESVIELALSLSEYKLSMIDIGCGSGILGITLSLERPNWKITVSDISEEALSMAKTNARNFHNNGSITFINQDLLDNDSNHYDLIVANLPYVPDSFKKNPDLHSEPETALFSGQDGLNHYRNMFEMLENRAQKPRFIIIESLDSQHQTLISYAKNAGYKLTGTQGLAQLFTLAEPLQV